MSKILKQYIEHIIKEEKVSFSNDMSRNDIEMVVKHLNLQPGDWYLEGNTIVAKVPTGSNSSVDIRIDLSRQD